MCVEQLASYLTALGSYIKLVTDITIWTVDVYEEKWIMVLRNKVFLVEILQRW